VLVVLAERLQLRKMITEKWDHRRGWKIYSVPVAVGVVAATLLVLMV
jgi:hypothetical protein